MITAGGIVVVLFSIAEDRDRRGVGAVQDVGGAGQAGDHQPERISLAQPTVRV
jgi:hypothetical protein